MSAMRAHVRNGHIVVDERTALPEGSEVLLRLVVPDEAMTAEERTALDAAIDEGLDDFARGDVEDAAAFAVRLLRA